MAFLFPLIVFAAMVRIMLTLGMEAPREERRTIVVVGFLGSIVLVVPFLGWTTALIIVSLNVKLLFDMFVPESWRAALYGA